MKKLLSLLGAIGLVATSSATVVSCGGDDTNETDTTVIEVAFAKDLATLKQELADKLNEGVADENAKVSVDNLFVTADQANLDSHVAFLNKAADDTDKIDGVEVSKLVAGTEYVWAEVTPATPAQDATDDQEAIAAVPAAINQQGTVKMAEEVVVKDLTAIITETSFELPNATDKTKEADVKAALSTVISTAHADLDMTKIDIAVSLGSDADAANYVGAKLTSKDTTTYTTPEGGIVLTITYAAA